MENKYKSCILRSQLRVMPLGSQARYISFQLLNMVSNFIWRTTVQFSNFNLKLRYNLYTCSVILSGHLSDSCCILQAHTSPHVPYVIKLNTSNAEVQNNQSHLKQPTYYYQVGMYKLIITASIFIFYFNSKTLNFVSNLQRLSFAFYSKHKEIELQ